MRFEPLADGDDRAFPRLVDHRERRPGGASPLGGVKLDPVGREVRSHVAGDVVVPQRREEQAGARELGELHRGDRATAARTLPGLGGVLDPAGGGDLPDPREPDPFDVADHGQPHRATVAAGRSPVS